MWDRDGSQIEVTTNRAKKIKKPLFKFRHWRARQKKKWPRACLGKPENKTHFYRRTTFFPRQTFDKKAKFSSRRRSPMAIPFSMKTENHLWFQTEQRFIFLAISLGSPRKCCPNESDILKGFIRHNFLSLHTFYIYWPVLRIKAKLKNAQQYFIPLNRF